MCLKRVRFTFAVAAVRFVFVLVGGVASLAVLTVPASRVVSAALAQAAPKIVVELWFNL